LDINQYISASDLKRRGWRPGLIKKLMPLADDRLPNPHYPNAAPMKMYLLERVVMIESCDEFTRMMKRAERQGQVLLQCFTKKRDALAGLAGNIEIPDFKISEDDLFRRAALEFEMRSILKLPENSSILIEHKKIAIDILLELQEPILWALDDFYQHQGIREARKILRRRILAKIIATFSTLKEESLARAIEESGDA
jgi:hypothetical protein